MPWTNLVHPEHPIVEVCCTGVITPGELSAGFAEALDLARTHSRTRILADCKGLAGGHSIADLYFLANALAAAGKVPQFREALLLPSLPDSIENVKFWETTCANRGLNVRLFDNRERALRWLLETP